MSAPIIITVPNSYLGLDVDLEEDSKVVVDVPSQPSRKRRLDHLTWEEKMQRKKLKNRVAAQTSRDRKKARMDEMEFSIKKLVDANERLSGEVASLKALNERLISENESLRAARDVAGGPGPAESSPRQKEGPPAALRATQLLLAMLLLSQNSSRTSAPKSTSTRSINWQTPSSKNLIRLLKERLKMSQKGALESALKELKWWGPQQSTWNPMEVQA